MKLLDEIFAQLSPSQFPHFTSYTIVLKLYFCIAAKSAATNDAKLPTTKQKGLKCHPNSANPKVGRSPKKTSRIRRFRKKSALNA